jgi:hypothetical protein
MTVRQIIQDYTYKKTYFLGHLFFTSYAFFSFFRPTVILILQQPKTIMAGFSDLMIQLSPSTSQELDQNLFTMAIMSRISSGPMQIRALEKQVKKLIYPIR